MDGTTTTLTGRRLASQTIDSELCLWLMSTGSYSSIKKSKVMTNERVRILISFIGNEYGIDKDLQGN